MAENTRAGESKEDIDHAAFRLGRDELVIQGRYEALSILNDFFIAGWFLVGSICFLFPPLKEVGAWLFIVGSAQFMVRPTLRLARRIHLRKPSTSRWDM